MNLSEPCLTNKSLTYLKNKNNLENETTLIQNLYNIFKDKTLNDFKSFCENTFEFEDYINDNLYNCSLNLTIFKNNPIIKYEDVNDWIVNGILWQADLTRRPNLIEFNTYYKIRISCKNEFVESDNDNIPTQRNIINVLYEWIDDMSNQFIQYNNTDDILIFNDQFPKIFKEVLTNKLNEFINKRNQLALKLTNLNNKLTFTEMLLSFEIGKIIEFYDEYDNIKCGIFNGLRVDSGWTGTIYKIKVQCIEVGLNNNLYFTKKHYPVAEFKGSKLIKNLPIKLLQNKTKQLLKNRGNKLLSIIKNLSNYMNYTGSIIQLHPWFGVIKSKAIGRCMIDVNAFCKFNPSDPITEQINDLKDNSGNILINDDNIILLPSIIQGYSLVLKKWVSFNIEELEEVKFNPQAYDLLVMNKDLKSFLNKLCNNYNKFNDIVNDKSGGQIILLHGKPGTGKTLTAETLAELKQVPLYIVTAGELGVELQEMEKRLNDLLELAEIWKAIILLDEADVFLEKRSSNSDIERNAMVGVFLRKLEYFNGIMILTSNRKDIIDDAIMSRVTVSIGYPNLNHTSRKIIWKNLTLAQKENTFKLSEDDFNNLANYEINGRQIKNIIKNTMWISEEKSIITYDDIHKVLCLSLDNIDCKEK